MPFIAVATDFNHVQNNPYYHSVYNFIDFGNDVDFVITFGAMLILFYIFRSSVNLFYFYMLARFTQGRYLLLAYRLFENYMALSYKDFVKINSSTLTKNIMSEATNLTNLISAKIKKSGVNRSHFDINTISVTQVIDNIDVVLNLGMKND